MAVVGGRAARACDRNCRALLSLRIDNRERCGDSLMSAAGGQREAASDRRNVSQARRVEAAEGDREDPWTGARRSPTSQLSNHRPLYAQTTHFLLNPRW